MDGLQRLLDFTHYLRSQRLLFHVGQESCDAITVSFGTFGDRFSLDFHENDVKCRRYGSMREANPGLHEIHDVIAEGGGSSLWPARVFAPGERDLSPLTGGMRRLLDFTEHLRARGIVHTIEQQSCDALEVSFSAQGKRIEVEFSPDHVHYSVFRAEPASAFDEDAVRREVEVFTRPYHPAMRMRREWQHAGE